MPGFGGVVIAAKALPAAPARVTVHEAEASPGISGTGGGPQEVPGGERHVAADQAFAVARPDRLGDDRGGPGRAGARPPQHEAEVLLPVGTAQVAAELARQIGGHGRGNPPPGQVDAGHSWENSVRRCRR